MNRPSLSHIFELTSGEWRIVRLKIKSGLYLFQQQNPHPFADSRTPQRTKASDANFFTEERRVLPSLQSLGVKSKRHQNNP
jgi:hypothetical protein